MLQRIRSACGNQIEKNLSVIIEVDEFVFRLNEGNCKIDAIDRLVMLLNIRKMAQRGKNTIVLGNNIY